MIEYVVDAHALVWMLEGNPRLGAAARMVLADQMSRLILPITALTEACWVVNKGRTSVSDWRGVFSAVATDRRIHIAVLDAAIVERAMSLPVQLEMHDAHIVATALIRLDQGNDVRLLTMDKSIIDSRLVPIVW